MRDPYLILGLTESADDAAVEAAYLEGIKHFPPERDAHRFEALRTYRDRVTYELFDASPPEPADLLDKAVPTGASCRQEPELLATLLRGDT